MAADKGKHFDTCCIRRCVLRNKELMVPYTAHLNLQFVKRLLSLQPKAQHRNIIDQLADPIYYRQVALYDITSRKPFLFNNVYSVYFFGLSTVFVIFHVCLFKFHVSISWKNNYVSFFYITAVSHLNFEHFLTLKYFVWQVQQPTFLSFLY